MNGTGTPLGMLAEMLAAGCNPNVHGGQSSAVLVEDQVLSWLAELLGYPPDAGGLLVSGGSMANLAGLAVAVNARAEFDVARHGLGAAPRPMVLYASQEVHYSVDKAVRVLGLGAEALRKLPVDEAFRIDVAALERAVAEDRAAGFHPFCVVGTAGTVNTGACDDLPALADLARRDGMWLHVDGAFGALAALAPSLRPLVAGLDRADSLAFDLHKWLYVPIDAGAVFVRDAEAQRRAFAVHADYLIPMHGGIAEGAGRFGDRGLELTRGFRALKVWMSLKEHGADTYGRAIAQNVAHARYLAGLVEREPELELLAPVPLNVVCFRYVPPDGAGRDLNELNRELLVRLHEGGAAAPSHTVLGGRFALRAAITNHRSRDEDFELLAREVIRIGRELGTRSGRAGVAESNRSEG